VNWTNHSFNAAGDVAVVLVTTLKMLEFYGVAFYPSAASVVGDTRVSRSG